MSGLNSRTEMTEERDDSGDDTMSEFNGQNTEFT